MMKLNLDVLDVESFDTAADVDERGTVHAAQGAEMSDYPPTACPERETCNNDPTCVPNQTCNPTCYVTDCVRTPCFDCV
ncbi:MAG TPA: hypothetical protein VFQ45_06935 [Longimicrobium sp.]|nr:hypothetical protein [Longimicrobium sp.]